MDIDAFLSLLNRGGVIALLSFNVWAFVTGKVVAKWVHDDVVEDRNQWRQTALLATDNADRSLMEAERHYAELSKHRSGGSQ